MTLVAVKPPGPFIPAGRPTAFACDAALMTWRGLEGYEVYQLRAVNNGQAQVWWTAPDGPLLLLACVADAAWNVLLFQLDVAANAWSTIGTITGATVERREVGPRSDPAVRVDVPR